MAITRTKKARQMLKDAGFVVQDGFKNYIKNSDSVTVPRKFKSRANATPTKLAYITADEAKMLKKMKPDTPHKGPSGIPSYDDFDAQGNFTSGAAMSAMESGSTNARDRAEVKASNYGAPSGAGPGVKTQAEQDLRSSVIAAGAGQRVNPGFFDSRDVISPAELAAARAFARDRNNLFAKQAMRRTRGGGLMSFLTGGGFTGALIRGLGQKFGLGKRFNQPTYDMSRFSGLPLGGSAAFANLDIRDKFDRRGNIIDEDDEEKIITENISPDINLLAQPTYNLDGTVRPDAFNYTTDFDINTGQFDDNNFGITKTRQFDDSPYGRIGDYDEIQ
jgi:hypothetical protein